MPLREEDGTLKPTEKVGNYCLNCNKKSVVYQIWEALQGKIQDYKFTCTLCNDTWWSIGPENWKV